MPTAPTGAGVFGVDAAAIAAPDESAGGMICKLGKSRGCECVGRRFSGAGISYANCVRLSTARAKATVHYAR